MELYNSNNLPIYSHRKFKVHSLLKLIYSICNSISINCDDNHVTHTLALHGMILGSNYEYACVQLQIGSLSNASSNSITFYK